MEDNSEKSSSYHRLIQWEACRICEEQFFSIVTGNLGKRVRFKSWNMVLTCLDQLLKNQEGVSFLSAWGASGLAEAAPTLKLCWERGYAKNLPKRKENAYGKTCVWMIVISLFVFLKIILFWILNHVVWFHIGWDPHPQIPTSQQIFPILLQ